MRNLKMTAVAFLGFAATAASACDMHFEMKGMQDGVQVGTCSCNGRVLGEGTWQQCYDATIGEKKRVQSQAAQAATPQPSGRSSFASGWHNYTPPPASPNLPRPPASER